MKYLVGLKTEDLRTTKTRRRYIERTIRGADNLGDYLNRAFTLMKSLDNIIKAWERGIRSSRPVEQHYEEILKTRSLAYELRREYFSARRLAQKKDPRPVRTMADLERVAGDYAKATHLLPETRELLQRSLERIVSPGRMAEFLLNDSIGFDLGYALGKIRFSGPFWEATVEVMTNRADTERDLGKLLQEYSKIFGAMEHLPPEEEQVKKNLVDHLVAKIRSFPPDVFGQVLHIPLVLGRGLPLSELISLLDGIQRPFFRFPFTIRPKIAFQLLGGEKLLDHLRLRYPATDLPELNLIEEVRDRLNQLQENMGDRALLQIGLLSLEEPITRQNIAARIRVAAGFVKPASSHAHGDEIKLYQTIGRFHGTKVAEWLVAHQGELDDLFVDETVEEFIKDLTELGVEVPLEIPWYEKVWDHLKKGEIRYIIQAGLGRTNKETFDKEEFDGRDYTYKTVRRLKPGFYLETLRRNGMGIGTIIRGNPAEGARLSLEVDIEGTARQDYLDQKYGESYAAGAAAVYECGGRKPAFLTIDDGQTKSYFLSGTVQGIAMILPQGNFLLSSLDRFSLPGDGKRLQIATDAADFFRFDNWCRDQKCDAFQSHLLVDEGENRVDKFTSKANESNRRLLVTFKDGSFGLVSFRDELTLYEAAYLALKIPGLRSAINLDTGGFDVANYQLPSGELVELGYRQGVDSLPNKVIFYTANQQDQR